MLLKKYRNKIKMYRCEGILFVKLRTMQGEYKRKCNFCRLWDENKGCLGDKIKQDNLYGNLGNFCKSRIGTFVIPLQYIKNLSDVIQEGSFI